MDESPVFITGLPRTGKTALRSALGAHPRLSFTRKSGLWKTFYGRFGDLSDPDNLERCLTAIASDPGAARLLADPEQIRRELADGERSYPELFGIIHSGYARQVDKARWGEQANYLDQYAGPIFGAWPEARMVHLVRDPSAWIASRSQLRPGGVGRELTKWAASAERAVRNRARFGPRYLLVQFERLRSDPILVLQEICDFIGEDVDVEMGETLVALLPDDAGSDLVSAARRYVEREAAATAGELGYSAHEAPPGRGASRLLADVWFGTGRLRFSRP